MKGTATIRSLLLLLVLAVAATFARGAGHRADVVAMPRPTRAIAAMPAPTSAQHVAKAVAVRSRTARTVTSPAATPVLAPAEAGMRIYLDPETGTVGPPPAGAAVPDGINPLNDTDAGLVQVRLPDGSYMVDLEGRFEEYYVVQTTPTGKRLVKCVQDPKQTRASGAVVPQPEER
jgi:hypothetical protein